MPGDLHERQRLTQLYRAMSNAELVQVASDPGALTDIAEEVLEDEAERRGLHLPDVVEQRDVPEFSELVIIQRFRDLPTAWLAKGALDAAGIESYLVDENMVRLDWLWSNFIGGVRLCVREPHAERALDVLEQPVAEKFDVAGVGEYTQPSCPKCGSLEVSSEGSNTAVAYVSLYFLSIPLRNHVWRCHACGHERKAAQQQSGAG